MSTVQWPRYDFLRSLIQADFPSPARLVELGAAPGDQAAALAHSGYEVTAVDIGIASDTWAGAPDGRMDQMFREAGIKSIEWNLEETPYPLPDASFDVVVMTEVYEHLRDYPVRSLHEVRRILSPGGRLYFTTPNAAYLMNRLRLLRGQSTATPLAAWIGGLPHARHAREYTFAEVDSLLRYAHLHPVARYGREFHSSNGIRGQAKKAVDCLARIRPELGPSIVFVAECTPLP